MFSVPANLYSEWRALALAAPTLHDAQPRPSEQIIQQIWLHQRLLRDQLLTLDGHPLRVLHPGFWNREAGPDFRGACLQFNSLPPCTGDVELDLSPQCWHHHGHDQNPAYQNVQLHVVWEAQTRPKSTLPTLELRRFIDAPLQELTLWLGSDPTHLTDPVIGQCHATLQNLPQPLLAQILLQAAAARLQSKAVQFQARARQVGWEQALWEGLFGALGYKHNVWPMRRAAELVHILRLLQPLPSPFSLQTRLLGLSGLLPPDLTLLRPGVARYFRQAWDLWWREQDLFQNWKIPKSLWSFHGLRPANHPQRRLALAAHWLTRPNFIPQLEHWLAQDVPNSDLPNSLLDILQVASDDFWSWHWTLRSAKMLRPQPLLGAQRLTDIAVNVILPWLWIRAATGRNSTLQKTAANRFFAWPMAEDNSVLRLARRRLFGTLHPPLKTAAAQQGLLQIVRDFCSHSNALCENCRFTHLLKSHFANKLV